MPGGGGETRMYLVPWSDLYTFLAQVAGTVVTVSGGSISTFSIPLRHPVMPGWFAQSMRWREWGASRDPGGGACIVYDHARVEVEYRSFPYGYDPNAVLYSASLDAAMQYVTIPGTNLYFPDGSLVYEGMPYPLATIDFVVTRYRIGNLDAFNQLAIPLIGKVNSAAFAIYGIDAGYVLLEDVKTNIENAFIGTIAQSAQMHYKYQSEPWGSKWCPSMGSFQMVTYGSASGPTILPTADINPPLTTV